MYLSVDLSGTHICSANYFFLIHKIYKGGKQFKLMWRFDFHGNFLLFILKS